MQFKSLVAGTNINLTSNLTNIVINNTAPLGEINTASNLGLGTTIFKQKNSLDLEFKSIIAGTGINIVGNNDDISIINTQPGEYNTGVNVGTGISLFKQKNGVDLEFKSLTAGAGISLTNTPNEINIINTSPGESNTASNIGAGAGVFASKTGINLEFKSLIAGANIQLNSDANSITVIGPSPGEVNTANNIGVGQGVFAFKTGVNLDFKSFVAGSGTPSAGQINIETGTGRIRINAADNGKTLVVNYQYLFKLDPSETPA